MFGWHRQRTRGHPPCDQFEPKNIQNITFWGQCGRTFSARRAVHQRNAAATVLARGSAKTVRRIVPDGFGCSTCAHLGRFAGWFLHVSSPPPLRVRSPPERAARQFRGGGWCTTGILAEIGIFLDPNAGAEKCVSTRSTFGQKIFSAETKMSSRSSSGEVCQEFFVSWVLQHLDGTVSAREDTPLRPTLEPKYPKNPTSGRHWAVRLRQARTLMYIRGTRQRRYLHAVPPKRCAESSRMASVAPPARIWDDSPAGSCTFRRRRRRRMHAPPPKRPFGSSGGGGVFHGYFG